MTLHQQTTQQIADCPVRDVLSHLGDRWTVLVLHALQGGEIRFGVLRAQIPDISPRMLSQTLRRLEQDGLIARTAYATIPPRVDYRLTELGVSFMQVIQVMLDWAKQNQSAVHAARQAYVPPERYEAK